MVDQICLFRFWVTQIVESIGWENCLSVFYLPVFFVPVYHLRETTGSCQWLLTDWSFLTHRSSGSSPLQPTTWSCTRIGCCQGNRETSFWVTGCQIVNELSSSRAIPSSFPQVSKVGKVCWFLALSPFVQSAANNRVFVCFYGIHGENFVFCGVVGFFCFFGF